MNVDLALLVLRVVVGLLFIGHGLQKLVGWFGGRGLTGTGQWLESLGLRPGRFWATVTSLLEALGGLGLLLGLVTGVAALAIIAVMVMAILTVDASKGLWNAQGGYEFPLVLIALAVALGLAGPGAWALDTLYNLPTLTAQQFGIGLLAVLLIDGLIDVWRRSQMQQRQA